MSIQSEIERLQSTKTSIKNAIVAKGQSVSDTDTFASYADKIAAIDTVASGTADATASAGDILSGKTAYVKGAKVTGNIASKGASDLSASGKTVTVPAGYYPSQVTKDVGTATQATPSISVSSAGLITASATQTAGYVSAGTKSATKQLTVQAAKTVTPGTADQAAVASGVYTTGAVTVKGDADLVAANIVEGKEIFGVTGNAEPASNLASELTTQDTLIADIMTALEGKSAAEAKTTVSVTVTARGGCYFRYFNKNGEYVVEAPTAGSVITVLGGVIMITTNNTVGSDTGVSTYLAPASSIKCTGDYASGTGMAVFKADGGTISISSFPY